MYFVVDAQLPPALAQLLVACGHTAEHVEAIGLREASDSAIWNHALENQAVLLTKDEDFPHRCRQHEVSPVVVWLRIGNTSRRALLQWFEPLLPQIIVLIQQDNRLIEVR